MLRILLLIVISYIVIRITLRLLLTESPASRRARMNSENETYRQAGRPGSSGNRNPGPGDVRGRFDHVEDAEFEEVPRDSSGKRKNSDTSSS